MQTGGAGATAIVIPVLNDWDQVGRLAGELDRLPALAGERLRLVLVDDGSYPPPSEQSLAAAISGNGAVEALSLVSLACNLGHQRAIAVGLVEVARCAGIDRVVVMDADGEDRPADVARLIAASARAGATIVLAQRARRSEGPGFRAGYAVYRLLFRILTGSSIRFGNFCLVPHAFLNALTHNPATWNNLAAAIMRSRLPVTAVPTDRGERYGGQSKMNFFALAVHGLSAISVYIDVTLIRIICAALVMGLAVLAALVAIVALRLFTGLAIPGWASFMGVSLIVLLFQALLFAGVALFQFLSLRSMPAVAPAAHVPQMVAGVKEIIRGAEGR